MMDIAPFLVIALGFIGAALACNGLERRERRSALIAYAVHVLASVAHWSIEEFYYKYTDSHGYIERGIDMARFLDADFLRYAPELAKFALHAENSLPFEGVVDATGTGTMSAIAGWFIYLMGPSLLSMSLLTMFISWVGLLFLYRVAREELPLEDRKPAFIAFFYVPSVVFWGSGFAKESIVLGFFGLLAFSTYRVLRVQNLSYLAGVFVGGLGVAMIKPYTLFPYMLGVIASFYGDRAWRTGSAVRIRPAYLVLAAALSVGGIAAMGSLFPQFGAEKVSETISTQQAGWQQTEGGSNIDMGDETARSLPKQLLFAPLALVNVFFRPAVFEAKNVPAFGAAIETTLLAIGVLSMFRRGRIAQARAIIFSTPILVFSVVFMSIFAVAVGLATSNLGSLSRYRLPMMPFYVMTLLVLRRRIKAAEALRAPSSRMIVRSRMPGAT